MSVDRLLSDVVQQRDLNEMEARRLVDGMRADVADLGERIATAYIGRAWIALGYASWDDLCDAEFDGARLRIPREQRAEQVQSLRAAGLSTRAIGSALGVGKSTVERDLATVPDGPVEVQSLDGRTRPSTQPARPQSSPPAATAIADQPAAAGGGGEPTRITHTEKTVEEFIADRDTGEVMGVEDWQQIQETADLDAALEARLASTDDRFLLNLARALASCNPLLALSPQRAAETCTPGSDDHAALVGFLDRMQAWTSAVRAASQPSLRRIK